jgi:hypothetical protein
VGDGRDALVGLADRVCSLVPVTNQVGDLAHLVRYDGADCGSCLSVYGNELGGRVAVSSYAPWHRLGHGAKRRQLLAVVDWVARGRLPVIIPQTVRVAPFVRMSADRQRAALVLLNMALDATGPFRLHVRASPRSVSLVSAQEIASLPVERGDDEIVVTIPSIPAWSMAVLLGQ